MAGEAELKIGSESVEKTTAALDSLIGVLEKLLAAQVKQTKSNDETAKSTQSVTDAVKQSEIARNKAIALLDLEAKGLSRTSEAYTALKGEILAQEVAAKKNIDTAEEDYKQLLANISAKEQAVAANKALVTSINSTTSAVKQSEIAAIKATSLMELEERGLDQLSDEYIELKAAIIAKDTALKKGIDTESEEYKQLLKSTTAVEKATSRIKESTRARESERKSTDQSTGMLSEFSKGLDDASKQAQLLDGPLGGIASRMTALSAIIKSGAILWAGLGVAATAVFTGISYGAGVAADQEVRMSTLNTQLLVTGNTAGYTAEQLDVLSRSLAMSTLDTSQGVKEIITQMLVFDKVSGEAFGRAVTLTQDMAIAMNGSASEASKKLGKILQEPVKYYTELAELGVTFDDQQVGAIKNAVALGETYQAQAIILDALEGKIAGVAKAQANGLTGDLDTFGQNWEELWETAGRRALPVLREIVQAGNAALEITRAAMETDSETTLRQFKQSTLEQTSTLEGTRALLEEVIATYDQQLSTADDSVLSMASAWTVVSNGTKEALHQSTIFTKFLGTIDSEIFKPEELRTEADGVREARDLIVKYLQDIIDAKEAVPTNQSRLSAEQEAYLKGLKDTAAQEAVLGKIFLATGDTRSEQYRRQKAAFDAYNDAKKNGLDGSPQDLAAINAEYQARQELTESIVAGNIQIQKRKAILGQQDALKKEIELNQLVSKGVQANSAEYLRAAALIDLRNKAIIAGEATSGEAYEALERETLALVDLQVEMKKVSALRQYDSESSTTKSLEKSLELFELTRQGLSDTSEEYIRQEMAINARNVALQAGFVEGDKEYAQILKLADAQADLQVQLQKTKDLSEIGISFSSTGELISDDSLAGLQDSASRSIEKILDVALSQGLSIDDKLIQQLLADVNSKFQDGKTQLVLPFGLAFTDEGVLYAVDSIAGIKAEMEETLREMDAEARELGIEEEVAYQERRAQIIREYEDTINDSRIESLRKSVDMMALIRAEDTANSIASGLENLSAVAGNNKKLAQMAKTAAIFAASASLVQGIAEANKLPWPTNIPAYAQAFLQGTQVVQLASSLSDPSFAFGGVDIQGAGTGRSDSIKANIARGESVVTAPATAQYKETLKRMNAGLPINGGGNRSVSVPLSINIQGDASENTVRLIDESLRSFEDRVYQIAQGTSMETIQSEQNYGGLLNQF